MATNLNVERLARHVSSVTAVTIPPMPKFPPDLMKRFPVLSQYEVAWELWREQLTFNLNKVIASAERSPPPT
jgi:hypothetical protein